MDQETSEIIKDIASFPGASESAIKSVANQAKKKFNFSLPEQYIHLLKFSNSVGGFISEYEFLNLYSTDEIISLNQILPVKDLARKLGVSLFVVGTDGSDLHYGFKQHLEVTAVVSIDFYQAGADCIDFMANTFNEFLKLLSQRQQ